MIDEYAELPEEASEYADSLARRGRAVVVTLVAATQRPTQRAMGRGTVRSQMDVRVCLRVRERRDVDLILGQGMTAAGWRPDALDAPGKFLLSDPENQVPGPARAYLMRDTDVRTLARECASLQPSIGPSPTGRVSQQTTAEAATAKTPGDAAPEAVLWTALEGAPEDGVTVAELMHVTGMSRPWTYRRLAEHATTGRAERTRRGHWRSVRAPDT